ATRRGPGAPRRGASTDGQCVRHTGNSRITGTGSPLTTMSKKNKQKNKGEGGIVYSTHPESLSSFAAFFSAEEEAGEGLSPKQQDLRVQLDRKQRAGKSVTLVSGYRGSASDLEALGKKLKNACGTG